MRAWEQYRNRFCKILLILLFVFLDATVFAAKKDFKGLFGSFRRERFTENEARDSDFGIDLMLSTLLPLTSVVKSAETVDVTDTANLYYATFFNFETSFFLTLDYNWQFYLNVGYNTYETRKENSNVDRNTVKLPLFHLFEMEAVPVLLGIKYRLGVEDIVPYFGLGAGAAYVRRKGYYDNGPLFNEQFLTVFTGEVSAGVEFYFASRSGIRLEMAGRYMRLPTGTFSTGGANPGLTPVLFYQGNLWTVRYTSGVFFLF